MNETLINAFAGANSLSVIKALHYGRAAHDSIGQVRKYSGEAYWNHPERVALTLCQVGIVDWEIIAAALLHDVLEDVLPHPSGKGKPFNLVQIRDRFSARVARLVFELTDVYTKQNFPKLNRHERHACELVRLSFISDEARIIKFSDIRDNTADILVNDPGYAKVYIPKKQEVVETLIKGFVIKDNEKISLKILDETTIIGQSIASQPSNTNG